MTTITVKGGAIHPPKPIKVIIDNLDNSNDFNYVNPTWFKQDFNLPPGKYMIVVSGMNQTNDTTEISIAGNFIANKKRKTKDTWYACVFIGEVK